MATKVIMPQLGESVVEGTVTRWLKREGETINELDALLEINTDKVDSEIPSPAGGTLLRILVPEGQTVRAGTILAWIGTPEEPIPLEAGVREAAVPLAGAGNGREKTPVPTVGRAGDLGFISPVVARMARENNLDLSRVKGTGANGRITKHDLLAFLAERQQAPGAGPAAQPPAAPWEIPADGDLFRPTEMAMPAQAGPETSRGAAPAAETAANPAAPARPDEEEAAELVPLSQIRKLTAASLAASKRTIPHATTIMEADMSRVAAHRQANLAASAREGVNLTYSAYFVAAAAAALKAVPIVNSSWSEEGIRLHHAIHIGLATSLGDAGLIVPVIQDADGLSLIGLARRINDLAARARSHRLQPEEVRGGTFTITNHGVSHSLFATPIINPPQCGILGVGMVQKRAVVVEMPGGADAIVIKPMVYLGLTFDHRILDGASADHFLGKVVETLQNWV